jgi:hypothetical protein
MPPLEIGNCQLRPNGQAECRVKESLAGMLPNIMKV